MSFNQKEAEKKRLEYRVAYLRKKTAQRQSAAQAVVSKRMEELEQGILVPTTLTEAELLLQRAKEVQVTKGLVSAFNVTNDVLDTRQEEYANRKDGPDVEDLGPPASMVKPSSASLRGLENKEDAFVTPGETPSSDVLSFLPLRDDEISERLKEGNVVMEKTAEEEQEQVLTALEQEAQRIRLQRLSLPIFQERSALLKLIRENPVLVVVGEPGCGKTTQLLQYLYEEGFHVKKKENKGEDAAAPEKSEVESSRKRSRKEEDGEEELRLICTQPRKIAAVSVAKRVAQEVGTRCGSIVGYKVRFDEKCGPYSRIIFMTDGLLLKEFPNDPMMEKVAAIMIDEAHERSINSDVLLGLLKDLLIRNSKLRIIVASATINAEKFSTYFGGAPIFNVAGRTFPVDVFYIEAPVADYVTEAAQTAMGIHLSKPLPGDILIFLPGQDSIEACMEALQQYAVDAGSQIRPMLLLPIFSALSPEEQGRIYLPTPPGVRKVVIATNIAETSITIDGVVYVVDCGLCKQTFYNVAAMTEELRVVPISQASALQRSGRAGRTQPGECFRLYTPFTFKNELPSDTIPELLRCSMSTVVLRLKVLGVDNLLQFEFLDPPSTASLEAALDQLFMLGAMKADGTLTVTGRRMAEFPLEPSWSKSLIRAAKLGCGRHMAMAAAMLTLDAVFLVSRNPEEKQRVESAKNVFFAASNGDAVGLVNVMDAWIRASSSTVGGGGNEFCRTYGLRRGSMLRARDVLEQLLLTMTRIGLDVGVPESTATAPDQDPFSGKPLSFSTSPGVVHIENFTKALLAGFFYNVARLEEDKRTYRVVRPVEVVSPQVIEEGEDGVDFSIVGIHPSSYLFKAGERKKGDFDHRTENRRVPFSQENLHSSVPPVLRERPSLVVFTALRYTTKRFMMNVTAITSPDWVMESAPENYFEPEMLQDPEVGTQKRFF